MAFLVRAAALTNYTEVARHLGLDPARLLGRHGLSLRLIADPEQRVPLQGVVALLEESAQLANCPTFGLRMAESRSLADFGAISLLLTHQRTLRDALRATIQYQHLLNESLALHVEESGATVVLREEGAAGGAAQSRQATELALGVLCRMCSALLGPNWHPRSVKFTHEAPPELSLHRRVFGCTPEFGCEFNGIVCRSADLDRPNPTADPAMARYAERLLQSLPGVKKQGHSVVLEVRKAIYLMLPMGRATIEQIAQGMGVNVRTLQRQLEEAGVTFSDLMHEVRSELVLRYMENPAFSLARIAELLGYGMPSSFTRWFNAQFGMAPIAWRRTLPGGSEGQRKPSPQRRSGQRLR
jgi:AraC-like DNA-binding protein